MFCCEWLTTSRLWPMCFWCCDCVSHISDLLVQQEHICCMWWALDVLHVICTRLCPGHSVHVGDGSQRSEEIVKNLKLRLWMRLLLLLQPYPEGPPFQLQGWSAGTTVAALVSFSPACLQFTRPAVVSSSVDLLLLSVLLFSVDVSRWWLCCNVFLVLLFCTFCHHLVGQVVKASTLRAEDPGFESCLQQDIFGVESYQWLKNWYSSGYPARRLAL